MSAPDPSDYLELPSREAWRGWLAENHARADGIWLAIGKKGTEVTSLRYDDVVEEALAFGWIDSTVRKLDADRFIQLLTPRRPGSIWSALNKRRVAQVEESGLMTDAGRAAIERAKADGSWDLATDAEALVMPDDLKEALAARPGARAGYDAYAKSLKQQVLYWVTSARRADTRARRIAETVTAAAAGRPPR